MSVFNNLRLLGQPTTGSLSVGDSELAWTPRGNNSGPPTKLAVSKVASAYWSMFGKYAAIAFLDTSADIAMRVDGFTRREKDTVTAELTKVGITVEDREYASSGVNRGRYEFEGTSLVVHQRVSPPAAEDDEDDEGGESRRLFEVDVRSVSQCVIPAGVGAKAADPKEVTMQFVESDAGDENEHQLVELRLYVPSSGSATMDDQEVAAEGRSQASALQESVVKLSKLSSGESGGSMIASFAAEDGTFLLPRGRYAIEMYSSFFRMHGNVYDYKIQFKDVERFILLPKTDDLHYVFIVCLDKPIRQGQQRYQHLVWQIGRSDKQLELALTDEEIDSRYGAASGLKPLLDGPLYQLVARAFKVLSSKKVFTTGKFRSFDDRNAINCSLKAKTGQLYPLERSFVFIHQPTLLLKFEDVSSVEFERFSGYGAGTATRNFDLRVQMKAVGGDPSREHTFTSIERSEYKALLEFLSSKSLKIRNLDQTKAARDKQVAAALGNDLSDDDDDEIDPYKNKIKNVAREKGDEDEGDDEEASEEDEDFNPDAKKASDEESSDDDEDEEDSANEGDEEAEKPKKKKKKEAASDEEPASSPEKKKKKKKKKEESPSPKKKKRSREDEDEAGSDGSEESFSAKPVAAAGKKKKPEKMTVDQKPKKKQKEKKEPEKKKKKKKKDPNAPKQAASSYLIFCSEQRPLLKEKDPSLSAPDVLRALGALWKEQTEDQKQPFIEKAKIARVEYEKQLAEYKEKKKQEADDDDDGDDDDEEED